MTWVKIDDGFARHPKVVAAGPLCMAMQIAALCYCNKELTDGFIPRSVARTLIDWEFINEDRVYQVGVTCGMQGSDVDCAWVIELMVEAGMWERVEGGYKVHDFDEYQPSRESVLLERSHLHLVRSEAGKKGAESRWNGKPYGKSNGKPIARPWQGDGPEPVPIKKEITTLSPKKNARLPNDWEPGEKEIAYALDKGMANWREEAESFRIYWGGNGKPMADWSLVWMRWVRTALERRRGSSNGKVAVNQFNLGENV